MNAILESPMIFWLGLALKIAMTAGIVVAASVVVERSGPFVGSLIASLPTAGGAAMIIIAVEQSPAFVAQSAVGGMVANAVCALFALTYAALAQRFSLTLSLVGAFAVWLTGAFASRFIEWNAATALLANAVVYPVTIYSALRFLGDGKAQGRVTLTGVDLAWRAGVVTLSVVVVTALSSSIGSYFSGVFAFFPVAMGSYFVILHPRIGGPATASVAAHVQAPLVGLCLSLFAVHFLAEPIGVWWAYAVGLSIGMSWNGGLWLWRRRARSRDPA
jgi:uncharacterized membrane protein (GlpM family)